ncbi:hypothetical protein GCM10027443_33240 [Pontibacter brevis]
MSYSQHQICDIDKLYSYLHSKGLADKGDKEYIKCTPIVTEANGDGVYSFGIDETDSFTFFFIQKDSIINFVDNSKIDNIFNDASVYLRESTLPVEKKIYCYQKLIEITKANTIDYPWYLPEKEEN